MQRLSWKQSRLIFIAALGVIIFIASLSMRFIGNMRHKDLRVAYLIDKSIEDSAIDPARIELVKQANLVRALYGRLIEFSQDGSIRPSLAESINISGNTIVFKMREGLLTKDLRPITARDAAFSFKRLLVLKSNLHASLEQFLCEGDLTKITDICSGINWDNNNLILKVKGPTYSQFLIPLLANVDFSIIPYDSINWGEKTLPIIDYRNTSGAYFVERDESENGEVHLKQNINNPNLTANSADKIVLVKAGFEDASKLFLEDKVDVIPTIYQFSENFLRQTEGIRTDLHKSLPVRIWFAKFNNNRNHQFSQAELKYIAKALKSALPVSSFDAGFTATNQMFPTLSEADLNENQKKEIENFWISEDEAIPKTHFRIWAPITKVKALQEAFKNYPMIEFYYDKVAPWNLPENEKPNGYIIATDSTFFEDLSVINYNLSMGAFGYSKEQTKEWINKYIKSPDKLKRISLLKELHFNILKSLEVIPLGFTPYFSVSRNGWQINFSKYYAGSPLWLITRE